MTQKEKEEKQKKCNHNFVVNKASPPYEQTFYCTKCDLQEDGWGTQW